MTSLRIGPLLVCVVFGLAMFLCAPAFAGSEPSPELRELITNASMSPWGWRPIPLDETLRRGLNGERVSLRQFVPGDKPLIAYNYGYW